MLRLLALALLLPTLAQAQSVSLFPCLSDAEWQELHQVVDPEPFVVWGDLAGFRDDGSLRVCTSEADLPNEDADAPALFYTMDDERDDGGLVLDAIVEREGRPVPFAVVIVTTRDERGGPIQFAAASVADRDGAITMTLPAARNAIRITISGDGDGPPDLASLRERLAEPTGHETSVFARQSRDTIDILFVAGPASDGTHEATYHLRRYKNKHKKVQLMKQLRARKHFT